MQQSSANNLIERLGRRLDQGRAVIGRARGLGRIHIERAVPFLCLHRRPADREDAGTERLVMGEAAFILAGSAAERQSELGVFVGEVAKALADRCGALILAEVWSAAGSGQAAAVAGSRPVFRLFVPKENLPASSVAALARALRAIPLPGGRAKVCILRGGRPAPPQLPLLLTTGQARRIGCFMLGIEVPAVWRDEHAQEIFPAMLRQFRRYFSRALQRGFFSFMQMQTTLRAPHYQALGPRQVTRAVIEADQQLAEIAETFPFLLAVTPVNAAEAYAAFRASGFSRAPVFHYRLLSADPELLKRKLYNIAIERIEDPALAELFREQRIDLDRQITMLEDRETRRFLYGSLQVHGSVEAPLLQAAEQLLDRPGQPTDEPAGAMVDASVFAEQARRELENYRSVLPELEAGVEVREDVPGILVSQGRLLINRDLELTPRRAEALIQHEVSTHLLTWFNGGAQPLRQLRCGLPGYEALQEGLAVLAEHLVGGLTPARLRLLAARVVAVQRLVNGRSFVEVFMELHERYGFGPAQAFNITMRVFRSGGLCKDAVYLRGLMGLMRYLERGGKFQDLLIGKISFESLPIIRELRWRGVLRPPALLPRYLESEDAQRRLAALGRGLKLTDLCD
jgi:uncharacterized protein (TIGR02421 family)